DLAASVLLDEEVGLMASDGCCHRAVRHHGGEVVASCDRGQVVPVPRVTFTADTALRAEYMRGRGFLPKGARDAHDQRRGGGEGHLGQVFCNIAGHRKYLVWFSCGTATELQRNDGCYIPRALRQ